jgi:hypothetical protein
MGFYKMKRTIEMIVVNPTCEINKFKSRQFVNKIKVNTIVGFILFSLLCLILNNLESVQAILQETIIRIIK